MKKILTIIVLLAFFVVTASALTGHLKFMGIPIRGTPISLVMVSLKDGSSRILLLSFKTCAKE